MNIYDKFPLVFVRWAVEHGMHLELNKDYIDLCTGMKSHCHLYYENGKYIAKMRYDKEKVIECFNDLHSAVQDCECYKGFMSGSIAYLYENGFPSELEWEEFK